MIDYQRCMGLTDTLLVPLNDHLQCLPQAKDAFLELQNHALKYGFELAACSAFRSFDAQATIFNAKFNGQRVILDKNEHPLSPIPSDPIERIKAILLFSAMPGFSRHHFGSDFDVYAPNKLPLGQKLELTYHEYDKDSYFYEFGCYLKENLSSFGFANPYMDEDLEQYNRDHQESDKDLTYKSNIVKVGSEPWHISHLLSAQQFEKSFDYQRAIDYLASCNFPFSPYVKAVMTYDQANAMLKLNHS